MVIGSGPNGLSAAIVLARAGWKVVVHEAQAEPGGGARSAGLTLPGFVHDVCSAIHPMAVCSPFFEQGPLEDYGLEWIHPGVPLAHPFDDGSAAVLDRSIGQTAASLGPDGDAWRRLLWPMVAAWTAVRDDILAPPGLPAHPWLMARFGRNLLSAARRLAERHFRGRAARGLFAGLAAHSVMPLEERPSAAIGLVLAAAAHASGWPLPRGGAGAITRALGLWLARHGGEIRTSSPVAALPDAPMVMCDVTPRQFLSLAAGGVPPAFRRSLERFRYGPGVFKMDWALDGPIPWTAAACARAGTVHLGGTLEEIAAWESTQTGRPFVLLTQPSLFDPTRAPAGKHTAWAYCHVPNGSTEDYSGEIERQVERFAPGFRGRILARRVSTPADLEAHNANLVGGDISGGAMNLRQIFLRPTMMLYRTPLKGVWLCSSSTPPGGGVHGMCGYLAAKRALRERHFPLGVRR